MPYSVDGLALLLELFRGGLDPRVRVMTRIPDHLPDYVPLVVVRRTGGASRAPRFYDRYLINVQVWCGGAEPIRDSFEIAEQVRRILWTALEQQTVTQHGHIIDVRESRAPAELADPDLPLYGRNSATYELTLRLPQPG
jgi:hypothetical protein